MGITDNRVNEPIEALVLLAQQGDEEAANEIVQQNERMVRAMIKKGRYFLQDGDYDDLVVEGMMGIYKAIKDYDPSKVVDGNFKSFCFVCIDRMLISRIKSGTRKKHQALNNFMSYDQPLNDKNGGENANMTVMDLVSNETVGFTSFSLEHLDPAMQLEYKDLVEQFENFKKEQFTDKEQIVFEMSVDGYSYEEITERTKLDAKAIDNAIQRARRKIELYTGKKRTKTNIDFSFVKKNQTTKNEEIEEETYKVEAKEQKGTKRVMKESTYRYLEATILPNAEKEQRVKQLMKMYPDVNFGIIRGNLIHGNMLEWNDSHYSCPPPITEKGKLRLEKYRDTYGEFVSETKLELPKVEASVVKEEKEMEKLTLAPEPSIPTPHPNPSHTSNYSNEQVLEIVKTALEHNQNQADLTKRLEENEERIQYLECELGKAKRLVQILEEKEAKYKEKVLSLFELN